MKKPLKYTLISILVLIVAFFFVWAFYLRNVHEKDLIIQGNSWVKKIEQYRVKQGRLPNSMTELNVKVSESGPLYYYKKDSINYIISFGTSLGESKIYYSDTKQWEDGYRSMKESK